MGVPHTKLPVVLTSFIGRQQQLADTKQLLTTSRLVTLTGAAGCGKTRLALRVAADVTVGYPDGVHWIELARLADPELVPQAVAKALHVAEEVGHSLSERLPEVLRDKQLLLVLDNCEHVMSTCMSLVESLLLKTDVHILATSREPLRVTGEHLYPVSPLPLPPIACPPDEMGHYDAAQLFVERARALVPAFELTSDNAPLIARICRHLDGIPLAIELASARVNVLTVEQIAARLDDHFVLLAEAPHVTHSHHHTLHAALDWSYDLLSTPEQVLLRRLSVFRGGCSLTTVESVCAGDGIEHKQVLDLLSALVHKSLVTADTLQRNETRYSLLETIRQYAEAKLVAAGEAVVQRDRHLHCFLELAGEVEPKLRGSHQPLWLDWLEGEYDNIRAALSWSLEGNHIEAGLRIAIAIYQFWTIRDYVAEGLAWLEQLLARENEAVSSSVHAKALVYAATTAGFRGNKTAQMAYGDKAAALAEKVGDEDKEALVWALSGQAYGARAAGDYQTEFALAQQVIQLRRELGDPYMLSLALTIYSFTAMSLGKYDVARAQLDEGLPLIRQLGNPYRIAMALNFSGDLARCEQDYLRAQTAYEESSDLLRDLGAVRDLASVLHNLGHTYLHLGEVARAQALFSESLAIHQEQQNQPGVAECLIGFAALAVVCGLPGAGIRLLAAAVAIEGQQIATAWAATQMEYDHYLAQAKARLTEDEYEAEHGAGRAFSLDQAIAYAHDVARQAAALQPRDKPDALTAREREVVALVAQARSNSEIAEELVLSKRTVEKHISNIRSKLGFTQRAQIVRWALDNELLPGDR